MTWQEDKEWRDDLPEDARQVFYRMNPVEKIAFYEQTKDFWSAERLIRKYGSWEKVFEAAGLPPPPDET